MLLDKLYSLRLENMNHWYIKEKFFSRIFLLNIVLLVRLQDAICICCYAGQWPVISRNWNLILTMCVVIPIRPTPLKTDLHGKRQLQQFMSARTQAPARTQRLNRMRAYETLGSVAALQFEEQLPLRKKIIESGPSNTRNPTQTYGTPNISQPVLPGFTRSKSHTSAWVTIQYNNIANLIMHDDQNVQAQILNFFLSKSVSKFGVRFKNQGDRN